MALVAADTAAAACRKTFGGPEMVPRLTTETDWNSALLAE